MRRTMKKMLLLPALALTFGMVACESNPTAPALSAPSAASANRFVDVGELIERDSVGFEVEIMGAPMLPPPPDPNKYGIVWP